MGETEEQACAGVAFAADCWDFFALGGRALHFYLNQWFFKFLRRK
jgi:hypothetical protein